MNDGLAVGHDLYMDLCFKPFNKQLKVLVNLITSALIIDT